MVRSNQAWLTGRRGRDGGSGGRIRGRAGMQRAVRARRTGGEAVAGSASALLGGGAVLRAADVDVGRARERRRQRRLARLAVVLWVATLAVWWRVLTGGSLNPLAGLDLGPDAMLWLPAVLIVVLIGVVMLLPMAGQGRSPHLTWRPEQIDVGLDDVKGLGRCATRSPDPEPVSRLRHLQGPPGRQPAAGSCS